MACVACVAAYVHAQLLSGQGSRCDGQRKLSRYKMRSIGTSKFYTSCVVYIDLLSLLFEYHVFKILGLGFKIHLILGV